VQHFDDSVVAGHVALVIKCPGHTTATAHPLRGADCGSDGAATDAGASAAISIANPIATLRKIDVSSNVIVRHGLSGVGILRPLMMTCIGEPPAWAEGIIAVGLHQLRHRRGSVRDGDLGHVWRR
jgi:hypothetical protein